MEEFNLPVNYKGREEIFNVQLKITGYTYRLVVDVYGQPINFERDEERNFRALLDYDDVNKAPGIDSDLVKAIGDAILSVLQ